EVGEKAARRHEAEERDGNAPWIARELGVDQTARDKGPGAEEESENHRPAHGDASPPRAIAGGLTRTGSREQLSLARRRARGEGHDGAHGRPSFRGRAPS